jgi:microcystin-dependent protein
MIKYGINYDGKSATMPVGWVGKFNGSIPPGFLECNGVAYRIIDFERLYAVIKDTYGKTKDGYFKVPDFYERTSLSSSL